MRARREWPDWLEVLRPDELTRERLRRAVARRSRPMLASRRGDWFDVASRWATLLSPVAAAVTILFAGLAVFRAPGHGATDQIADGPPRVEDLLHAEQGEALPAVFAEDSLADLDVVLTAISSRGE